MSVISTDVVPADIRNQYIYPYFMRTVPVILIWVRILFELILENKMQPAHGPMNPDPGGGGLDQPHAIADEKDHIFDLL